MALRLVKHAFTKYPVTANAVTFGSLYVTAEFSQQVLTKKVLVSLRVQAMAWVRLTLDRPIAHSLCNTVAFSGSARPRPRNPSTRRPSAAMPSSAAASARTCSIFGKKLWQTQKAACVQC